MKSFNKFIALCLTICLLMGGISSIAGADLYVLLVGIGKYENNITPLPYNIFDVKGFKDTFLENVGVPPDKMFVMTTESKRDDSNYPSTDHVILMLHKLSRLMKKEDTLFVYFSGHGIVSNQVQYLLCADANPEVWERSLSLTQLNKELNYVNAFQKIVILDACRNDPNGENNATTKDINPTLDKGLTAEANRITSEVVAGSTLNIIFACSAGQKARVFSPGGPKNSVFSFYMIEGLRGNALRDGTQLTLPDLYRYTVDKVRKWVEKENETKPKDQYIKQQPLNLGAESIPVVIAEHLHRVQPAKLELTGLDKDVKVEIALEKYNSETKKVELEKDSEPGTLTLPRPGFKPQTQTMTCKVELGKDSVPGTVTLRRPGFKEQIKPVTFKSDSTTTVSASKWEVDTSRRIRFVFPTTPKGARWDEMTFGSEVFSLENDKNDHPIHGKKIGVRTVNLFLLESEVIDFSIGIVNSDGKKLDLKHATLTGGNTYQVKIGENSLTVSREEPLTLQWPANLDVVTFVVPSGSDYQVSHPNKTVVIKVGGEPQIGYPGSAYISLPIGLDEKKTFWLLYSSAGGTVKRKTIDVTQGNINEKRKIKSAHPLSLPITDDNTEATLDVGDLPPGASATVQFNGATYMLTRESKDTQKIPMESYTANATVTFQSPEYDDKPHNVKLTAGEPSYLKSALSAARLKEQTVEIVGKGADGAKIDLKIQSRDSATKLDMPTDNSIKAKIGSKASLVLFSPGYYLMNYDLTISADKKQVVVEMERHKLTTEGRVKRNLLDGADMIYIPSGSYKVGAVKNDKTHELEMHNTASGGFWIYAHPVTFGQYNAYLATKTPDGEYVRVNDQYPITNITYEQAQAYANYAKGDLPSETEWEISVRGSNNGDYPWGDDWKIAKDWRYNAGKNASVGSNRNNHSSFGVCDIWGLVREWTKTSEGPKMIRGSSFDIKNDQKKSRSTWRSIEDAGKSDNEGFKDVGFRIIVRSAP